MRGTEKEEQKKDTILYKQYQEQNVEEDEEFEEVIEEKQLKGKNIAIYGILGVIVLMLGFVLYNTSFKKDTTQVVFKDAEGSNRVIKATSGQLTVSGNVEQQERSGLGELQKTDMPEDNEEENADIESAAGVSSDLYRMAVEAGFSGSREDFYHIMKKWNVTSEDLEKNVDKIKDLVEAAEDVQDGQDGKDGVPGRQGTAGKSGTDGKDGTNGKSTYIAYAEDASGAGFSLAPTEKTKCIGTCLTTEKTQPMTASAYTWQVYRSYVMTAVTDENNITTLYIQ